MNSMNRGAALLISILVLGTLFLSFAVVGVQGSIRESGSLVTLANKKRADSLARACMEVALFKTASSESYTGNESVSVGSAPCTIRPLLHPGSNWIIETEATFSNQVSRLRATLSNRAPANLVSLEAVATF